MRLLQWCQVFPLHILHQGFHQRAVGRDLTDYCRDRVQTGTLGRTPTTFPGHEHIAVVVSLHHDRLQHPQLPDRHRQLLDRFVFEPGSRLFRIGLDVVNFNVNKIFGLVRALCGDQRLETTTQASLSPRAHVPSFP